MVNGQEKYKQIMIFNVEHWCSLRFDVIPLWNSLPEKVVSALQLKPDLIDSGQMKKFIITIKPIYHAPEVESVTLS